MGKSDFFQVVSTFDTAGRYFCAINQIDAFITFEELQRTLQ
jgi:hypothetical protein